MIGIHATKNNFPPITSSSSSSVSEVVYKRYAADFVVIEVDENGTPLPTTAMEALTSKYQHVESSSVQADKEKQQQFVSASKPKGEDETVSSSIEFSSELTSQLQSLAASSASASPSPTITVSSSNADDLKSFFTKNRHDKTVLNQKAIQKIREEFSTKLFVSSLPDGTNEVKISVHPCYLAIYNISSDNQQTENCWNFLMSSITMNNDTTDSNGNNSNTSNNTPTSFSFHFKRNNSRNERTEFHEAVFKYFSSVQRKTRKTGDGVDFTRQVRRPRQETSNAVATASTSASEYSGYYHFILHKTNVPAFAIEKLVAQAILSYDLSEEVMNENKKFKNVNQLARFVQTCGNKDKRAVTYQKVSIPVTKNSKLFFETNFEDLGSGCTIHEVGSFGQEEDHQSVIVFHPSMEKPMKAPCVTGCLGGNVFRIRLRFSSGSHKDTREKQNDKNNNCQLKTDLLNRLEKIKSNGVANFFGPQRFGFGSVQNNNNNTNSSTTSSASGSSALQLPIGFLCACSLYKEAVLSMFETSTFASENSLSSSSSNQDESIIKFRSLVERAKEIFRNDPTPQGADLALKILPASMTDLADVLRELRKEFDFKKAVCNSSSFALRQMRVHAAQSLIFNEMLSDRMMTDQKSLESSEESEKASLMPGDESFLPMVGYETPLTQKKEAEEILNRILAVSNNVAIDQQRISIETFIEECKSMLGLNSFPGTTRPILMRPKDLRLDEFDDGESTNRSSSILLSCQLPPGSFVSVVIRELLGEFPKEP